MILADTSVWIGHFRDADQELIQRLSNHEICVHPFIVGEIALGSLSNRKLTLSYLKGMPSSNFTSRSLMSTKSLAKGA